MTSPDGYDAAKVAAECSRRAAERILIRHWPEPDVQNAIVDEMIAVILAEHSPLTAEVERLSGLTCRCGDGFSETSMCANCAAGMLKADNDQVRDAERYAWLRDGGCIDVDGKSVDPPRPFMVGPEFDAAIDAARKGE